MLGTGCGTIGYTGLLTAQALHNKGSGCENEKSKGGNEENAGHSEGERLTVVSDDEDGVVTERTGIRWGVVVERQKYQIRTEIILVNQFSKSGYVSRSRSSFTYRLSAKYIM